MFYYIINKESGFLVNKDYELIENIKLLIENPDIMKSMRLKAIEHSKSFDWDISSHDWSKAFMKLAG